MVVGLPVPCEADPVHEYRLRPGQDHRRFGNRILVNAAGMRSPPVAPVPETGTLRLLVLGDSVVNGGAETDHADLATIRLPGLDPPHRCGPGAAGRGRAPPAPGGSWRRAADLLQCGGVPTPAGPKGASSHCVPGKAIR